jgi:hypothetical protein
MRATDYVTASLYLVRGVANGELGSGIGFQGLIRPLLLVFSCDVLPVTMQI